VSVTRTTEGPRVCRTSGREGAVQGTRCHARTFQILAAGGWKHWVAEVPCWLELWL